MTKSSSAIIIALLLLLTSSGLGQSPASSTATRSGNEDGKNISDVRSGKEVTVENIELDISEALSLIEKNYAGEKLDYNSLFKSSIDSMLHTLDPHSNYFDSKEFEQFRTDQSSRYYGIGATIGDLSDAKGNVIATFIKATFENAPAHRAGLRYGDKIVEVNGESMLGKPYSEVRDKLRGARGTTAKIVVEKYLTGKQIPVEIVRDSVSQPSIAESYLIRPGVGYINMNGGFNQTTFAEFAAAMRSLKSEGMNQLVIDLRNNGGGLVGQAYRVANAFLANGQTVFTQKGRLGVTADPYRAENKYPDQTPIVVLVNRNTASASEILAGALQDHDRALIVGENTFGKGLVQNPFILEYGSMLLLTIAKYETPSGRLIQRDYSDGRLYDYYTNGGTLRLDESNGTDKPKGTESKTDLGRAVYGGGGINPDVEVKANTIPIERGRLQLKLVNPIFAFALDLTAGRISDFATFKVDRPISFEHDIKAGDFPVSQPLFDAFKQFAVAKFGISSAQIDNEREFVQRLLRSELVTAAYGSTTSYQVFNEYDNQLLRAIELLPKAKELASDGARAKSNAIRQRSESNR
ncbi:MAG: S41 family peptidase [Pyrinomonadaceae bacterium]